MKNQGKLGSECNPLNHRAMPVLISDSGGFLSESCDTPQLQLSQLHLFYRLFNSEGTEIYIKQHFDFMKPRN